MVKIKIPKEIRQYETKLVGPFTARQTVCLVIAALLSGGLAIVLKYGFNMAISWDYFIPIIVICMAFTAKPYGQKFEDYALDFIIDNFFAPPKRKYTTENYYQKISKPYIDPNPVVELDEKGKPIKKKKKKQSKPKKKKSMYKFIA
jgi:hypothetical protein